MDLQTTFYTLGSIFFFISLVIMTVFIVGLIFFYIETRKKINSFKKGMAYLKNAQDFAGKFPALFTPVILFFVNLLIKKIKARFSD